MTEEKNGIEPYKALQVGGLGGALLLYAHFCKYDVDKMFDVAKKFLELIPTPVLTGVLFLIIILIFAKTPFLGHTGLLYKIWTLNCFCLERRASYHFKALKMIIANSSVY